VEVASLLTDDWVVGLEEEETEVGSCVSGASVTSEGASVAHGDWGVDGRNYQGFEGEKTLWSVRCGFRTEAVC
jgi:hypothetical protein